MMLRGLHHKISILALLLLCLSGSLWLQSEHIHLQDHSPAHDCVVCHYGSAVAVGKMESAVIAAATSQTVTMPIISAAISNIQYRPPARAPPFYSV